MSEKRGMRQLCNLLMLPEKRGACNLDDTGTTLLHADIIRRKTFLRRLYTDFYRQLRDSVSCGMESKLIIEIGSGGGFIKEIIPNAVTSDVLDLPHVERRFPAHDIPFEDNMVDAFFMIDVLHHMESPRDFFREAYRCLKDRGKIVMIEPANTPLSRFICRRFHHEGFDPSGKWELEGSAPLSIANMALPWIIFFRDRMQFEAEFPYLKIKKVRLHTPLRYSVSGGLSMRQLAPSFTYNLIKLIEALLSPLNKFMAMFMTIELEKSR